MAEDDAMALSAQVHGRVQGVGFRMQAQSRARRLGLTGWVRNEPDGSVRVEAEGRAEAVRRYEQWLQQGPPGARVSSVDAQTGPATGRYKRFTIR
jgi:acylphosphatase